MIEYALRQRLINDATVGVLLRGQVSPVPGDGSLAPPYILYQRTGTPEIGYTQDGESGRETARIELTIVALSYEQSIVISLATRYALAITTEDTWDGVTVMDVVRDDEADDNESPPPGAEVPLGVRRLVYLITFDNTSGA